MISQCKYPTSLSKRLKNLPAGTAIVIGGWGFVGKHLAIDLLHRCSVKHVAILDINVPVDSDDAEEWYGWEKDAKTFIEQKRLSWYKVDVANLEQVLSCNAFSLQPSTLFHVASFGMSGSAMLAPKHLIWSINVLGVRNVLFACIKYGIPVAVYTSSYNVCFHGQSIQGGTEDLPYSPLDAHTEEYSKTKCVAERIWLGCNDMALSPLKSLPTSLNLAAHPEPWTVVLQQIKSCLAETTKSSVRLKTAAIRGSAIYGEGEARHFPRIVRHLKNNLLSVFTFGNPAKNRVDYVHVCNLNQLHILAAIAAHEGRVTGQAFFASDDDPKSQFKLLEPFHKIYNKPLPKFNLPLELMLVFAWMLEWLYFFATQLFALTPVTQHLIPYVPPAFLTRAEVYKSGQNHWCHMDKAKRLLGYQSLVKEPSVVAEIQKMTPTPPEEYSFGSMLGMHRLGVYFAAKD